MQRDPSRAEALADRLDDRDAAWRAAAVRAYAQLPAERVFERASGLFLDARRG